MSDSIEERLLGKCVRKKIGKSSFERPLEVIESGTRIYYLDSYEVLCWKENAQVYFVPDGSHAFDLEVVDEP